MNKPDVRAAVFGWGSLGQVVMVKGPKNGDPEACGLYIHIDDIEKYLEWTKQFEEPKADE